MNPSCSVDGGHGGCLMRLKRGLETKKYQSTGAAASALTWRVTTRCATSRKAFVSANNGIGWSASNRWFASDAMPNSNKPRTTASSNGWSCVDCTRMRKKVATLETRNKKKTVITCFAAAASISFATNRVAALVYNDAPSVGRQASENSGSGIASRVCVGQAARRTESAKK